jgi:hypothetical protein
MTSAFAKKAPKPADSTDAPVATEKAKKAPKASKKAGKKAAKKAAAPAPAGEAQPQQ